MDQIIRIQCSQEPRASRQAISSRRILSTFTVALAIRLRYSLTARKMAQHQSAKGRTTHTPTYSSSNQNARFQAHLTHGRANSTCSRHRHRASRILFAMLLPARVDPFAVASNCKTQSASEHAMRQLPLQSSLHDPSLPAFLESTDNRILQAKISISPSAAGDIFGWRRVKNHPPWSSCTNIALFAPLHSSTVPLNQNISTRRARGSKEETDHFPILLASNT